MSIIDSDDDAPDRVRGIFEAFDASDVHYMRLDGGEVSVPCCNVFRLRDGSVADYRTYIDVTPVYASAPPAPVGEPGA